MVFQSCNRTVRAIAVMAAVGLALAVASAQPTWAGPADSVFTVGNYPVDASDANAVAAKERALADGQQAAFRSLMKRIVPVTAYKDLARIKDIKPSQYISGVAVRSEQNSSTRYIASLDFTYQADAVRGLLQSRQIPFVETQAPAVTLVPIVRLNGQTQASSEASSGLWQRAWRGLDLTHTLTPLKLEEFKSVIHEDTVTMLANGDDSGARILAGEYGTQTVVLAISEIDTAAKRLNVTLSGRDAVGPLYLKRAYRMSDGDIDYASEYAAVVSLGILEGRWKAVKSAPAVAYTDYGSGGYGGPTGGPPVWSAEASAGGGEQMHVIAEFNSLAQWNEIRTQLLETPGVENLAISTVSARNADLALQFPGGPRALANALGARGLRLVESGAGWTLSTTY
ncbi:MAG: DUF2066 domain-containing protein [Hyphomicrobiaceae bacterium]|nr:DUF2066 domain-containing protein [Hyphomicrobiaceae bacterium]